MSVAIEAPTDEFARFFSLKYRALVSYRRDGRILIQRLGDRDFHPFLQRKKGIPLGEWIARKQKEIGTVPRWCFEVTELPRMQELEEWAWDSVVETPTGHSVEPDGIGPDGVPSWLRCLGLI